LLVNSGLQDEPNTPVVTRILAFSRGFSVPIPTRRAPGSLPGARVTSPSEPRLGPVV